MTGTDVNLLFKAKPKLIAHIGGLDITTHVNLNNGMQLKGITIQNPIAENITVVSATENVINGTSDMSFSTEVTQLFSFEFENVKLKLYDNTNTYIGYSLVDSMYVEPGFNKLTNLVTILDRNDELYDNRENIATFLSNFMMAKSQEMSIIGPVPINESDPNDHRVIDYGLEMSVIAKGCTDGDIILSGMITSETQQGWTVKNGSKSIDVKGAYSTAQNPLDVPVRLVRTDTYLYLQVN